MLRSSVVPLVAAVLAVSLGQAVLAVDEPYVAQPAPSDRAIVEPPASAAPAGMIHHDAEISKLPAGGVAAVESAVPCGTIVDVDRWPLMNAWEVKVVDQQGQVQKVHVDSKGQASNVRLDRGENGQVENLTEAQKSAVRGRFADAAIYDSEYAFVNGKRADKVYLLSQGQRYEVKVDRSTCEIYKVENESQEGEHQAGHHTGTKVKTHNTTNSNY